MKVTRRKLLRMRLEDIVNLLPTAVEAERELLKAEKTATAPVPATFVAPTEILLNRIYGSGSAPSVIDTVEDASPFEIQRTLPPSAGYSYVWLMMSGGGGGGGGDLRVDLYYKPQERGMVHQLMVAYPRPADGAKVVYALPCQVVHHPVTRELGLAVEPSGLWPPTVMSAALRTALNWVTVYTGFRVLLGCETARPNTTPVGSEDSTDSIYD